MHQRNSIINVPLLIGIVLSVALHGAALYSKAVHTPAKPSLEQGRTVVQLTLLPSLASKGNPNPVPLNSKPVPVPQASSLTDPTPPPEQPQASNPKPQISAPDQIASLIEEKGVTSEAQTFKAASPVYPRISQRRGEEGTVTLSIEVLANGQTGNISVTQSSGYRRLDEAALKAAHKTTYTPAKQFGRAIDSMIELPFEFRLTDD